MLPPREPETRPPTAETVKPVIWPWVELPEEFEVWYWMYGEQASRAIRLLKSAES